VFWLIQRDVVGGRSQFNFSEWNKPQDISVGPGRVDPRRLNAAWFYVIAHPNAKPNAAEKLALMRRLAATLTASPPKGGGGG